jgi:hypothetical protein
MRLVLFSLVAFLFVQTTLAAGVERRSKSFPGFVPGHYMLRQGNISQCGDGDFTLEDGGESVVLGVYHTFTAKDKTTVSPSDLDKKCVEVATTHVLKDPENLLTFSVLLLCGNDVRDDLFETAVFRKQDGKPTIIFSHKQTSAEGKTVPSYACVWSLDDSPKRAGASVPPPAAPKTPSASK